MKSSSLSKNPPLGSKISFLLNELKMELYWLSFLKLSPCARISVSIVLRTNPRNTNVEYYNPTLPYPSGRVPEWAGYRVRANFSSNRVESGGFEIFMGRIGCQKSYSCRSLGTNAHPRIIKYTIFRWSSSIMKCTRLLLNPVLARFNGSETSCQSFLHLPFVFIFNSTASMERKEVVRPSRFSFFPYIWS